MNIPEWKTIMIHLRRWKWVWDTWMCSKSKHFVKVNEECEQWPKTQIKIEHNHWMIMNFHWAEPYVASYIIRILEAVHTNYVERYSQSENYVRKMKRKTLLKYWAVGQSKCWLRVLLRSSFTLLVQDLKWKLIFRQAKKGLKEWKNENKVLFIHMCYVWCANYTRSRVIEFFFLRVFSSIFDNQTWRNTYSWFMVVFSVSILFQKDP